MKKFAFLLLIISVFILTSCATDKGTGSVSNGTQDAAADSLDIISYNGTAMPEEMYRLILSIEKARMLTDIFPDGKEDPKFWESEDGHAFADMIKVNATDHAMNLMYYNAQFSQYSLELEEGLFDKLRAKYIENSGSEDAFKKMLKQIDVSEDIFNSYLKMSLNAEKAAMHIHEESDIDPIREEDYHKYYAAHYITLRHLYINNKTYESGMALSDAKKQQINARADEIEKQLSDGADLADFKNETDDGVLASYPDGITIPLDDDLLALSKMSDENRLNLYGVYYYLIYNNPDFAQALLTCEEGTVNRVETQDGIFFIQRMPLDKDEAYDQFLPMIQNGTGIRQLKMSEVVSAQTKSGALTQNKDKIAAILIRDVKAFG